jgi:SpoVK/Ycf46/Vps4 family AAA+-type ATPase
MAEGRLLRQLVRAGAQGNGGTFRQVAEEVIRDERAKNHHLLANDLERILYGEASSPQTAARPVVDVPKDGERGLELLTLRTPVRGLADVVLSPENHAILEEVLLQQSRRDVLASHGLRPIQRLLLYGPSGCGKTSAAEVIATELGLELVTVRFDAVVSSFLGETSANLRKVFDFLAAGRYVGLFDEFDAIGKEREDSADHGELRRVVNAFLQLLDSYRGQSLLVAATNHEQLLDRALWRRFDEVLLLDRPSRAQLVALFSVKLRGVRHELPIESEHFLEKFEGLSHADVERVIIRAIKAMVLKGREFLTTDLVEAARRREAYRLGHIARPSRRK